MNNHKIDNKKICIVLDSLDQFGGAERVMLSVARILNAPVYTPVYNKRIVESHGIDISKYEIKSTWWGKLNIFHKLSRILFFIYPMYFESLDLSDYDIVISSSTRFAHSVLTSVDQLHVCYMHSVSRYVWDFFEYHDSLKIPKFLNIIYYPIVSVLRVWDYAAGGRPDVILTNSEYSRKRIAKFLRRDSICVHPFVELSRFINYKPEKLNDQTKNDYYIIIGRINPWKHLEYVIDLFNKNGKKLKIVGHCSTKYVSTLEKRIKSSNIELITNANDAMVVSLLSNAKGLIWQSKEDFGIVLLEAMAMNIGVIAYSKGFAPTMITDNIGVLYTKQTEVSLKNAIKRYEMKLENDGFDKNEMTAIAKQFSFEKFKNSLIEVIEANIK